MDTLKTVSDTKREFYTHHTRPINSIYRRIVEELMVEMHLLSVNTDFRPNSIYFLGVVTSFDRFMQGYKPEQDKESIFQALCQAVGGNASQYRQNAQSLVAFVKQLSASDLVSWLCSPTPSDGADVLLSTIQGIIQNPHFKYSRLFGIGLYTLLETSDSEFLKNETQRNNALKQIAEAWNLPAEKLQKDLEVYRTNLEKMTQMLIVLEDTLQADRKKREQRAQEQKVAE